MYLVIAAQLLFTVLFTLYAIDTGFGQWQLAPGNLWLLIVSIVIGIGIVIVLSCFRKYSVEVPTNYLLLGGFTLCMSYLVSYSVVGYTTTGMGQVVIYSAVLTFVMVFGLTIFAFQTKFDITGWGGYLFVAGLGLILFCIMGFILNIQWLYTLIISLCLILMGIYLVYDTQLLAGGKRQQFSEDDYIIAALNLYIDIVFIFLDILSFW